MQCILRSLYPSHRHQDDRHPDQSQVPDRHPFLLQALMQVQKLLQLPDLDNLLLGTRHQEAPAPVQHIHFQNQSLLRHVSPEYYLFHVMVYIRS